MPENKVLWDDSGNDALMLVIDYLLAENRILRSKYAQTGRRLLLTNEERMTLAVHAKDVMANGFRDVIQIFKPETLMGWYRRLVAKKYDSSNAPRKPGRPEIPPHVSKLILRIARENRSWGYDRIAGALSTLGHDVCPQSVANFLKRHGLEPTPERDNQGTWKEFIQRHLAIMWATDFFTVEVPTLKGLVRYYVLFFVPSRNTTRRPRRHYDQAGNAMDAAVRS